MPPRGDKRFAPSARRSGPVSKAPNLNPNVLVPDASAGQSINSAIQAKLAERDATIKNYFPGIQTEPPDASSGVPAYDGKKAASALAAGMPYVASCPLLWLNLQYKLQPNVPKYQSRIDALETHFFESPAHLRNPVKVFLDKGASACNMTWVFFAYAFGSSGLSIFCPLAFIAVLWHHRLSGPQILKVCCFTRWSDL